MQAQLKQSLAERAAAAAAAAAAAPKVVALALVGKGMGRVESSASLCSVRQNIPNA